MAINDKTRTPNYDIFLDEAETAKCKKNPGHKMFFTVCPFDVELLPPDCRTERHIDFMRNKIDRTVKVRVKWTSKDRPDQYFDAEYKDTDKKRIGTGYMLRQVKMVEDSPCPCPCCEDNPKKVHWTCNIGTATHVVFDTEEAKKTIFSLFYDTDNSGRVKHLYGDRVYEDMEKSFNTEYCIIQAVTHDPELAKKLEGLLNINDLYTPIVTAEWDLPIYIISHPHGFRKKITHGKVTAVCFDKDNMVFKLKRGTRMAIMISSDSSNDILNVKVTVEFDLQEKCQPLMCDLSKPVPAFHDIFGDIEVYKSIDVPSDVAITQPPGVRFHFMRKRQTRLGLGDDQRFPIPQFRQGIPLYYLVAHEFHSDKNYAYCKHYTYDVPTCPGSSGAPIIGAPNRYMDIVHEGHMNAINMNCSGNYNEPYGEGIFLPIDPDY